MGLFRRKQEQPLVIPEYMSETFDEKLDWVLMSNAAIQLTDAFARGDYPNLKRDLKKLFSEGGTQG